MRILVLLLLLLIPALHEVWADHITLTNGEEIECVILAETQSDVNIQLALGKITLLKNTIASIRRDHKEMNDALRKRWRKAKIEQKKKRQKSLPYKIEGDERLIRYKSRWITLKEYERTKKEQRLEQEERLEEEQKKQDAEKKAHIKKKIRLATEEAIRQGKKKRSPVGNRLLKTGSWLSSSSAHVIIFYPESELAERIKQLARVAEYSFDKIKGDLNLRHHFTFKEKIEVFLVNDSASWRMVTAQQNVPDTTHGVAHYYKKEIFLATTDADDKLPHLLVHELSHIFLHEFTITAFSKTHYPPLWLNEGFANFQGKLFDYALTPRKLSEGIHKNYYIKLDTLLALKEYPQDHLMRSFFYAESSTMVEFIITTYGRQKFNEFISQCIESYHRYARTPDQLTPQQARKIMRTVIRNSFLRNHYAGYASFEEAWMRFMAE